MEEKITTFLKGKLNGTPESYLKGVAEFYSKIITEEQIEETFNDNVIALLKHNADLLQKEGDRRATEATKNSVKNAFQKLGLDENGKPKEPLLNFEPPTNDEPAWFKKFKEDQLRQTEELKQKLGSFEKEKTQSQLSAKVVSKLKEKGISEKFYKGRNLSLDSEDGIEQLVSTIETDWNEFVQEKAEQGVVISIPQSPTGAVKEGEALGKQLAEKRNAGISEGVKAKQI